MAEIKSFIILDTDFHSQFEKIFIEKCPLPSLKELQKNIQQATAQKDFMPKFMGFFGSNKKLLDTKFKNCSVEQANEFLKQLYAVLSVASLNSPFFLESIILQIIMDSLNQIRSEIQNRPNQEELGMNLLWTLKIYVLLNNYFCRAGDDSLAWVDVKQKIFVYFFSVLDFCLVKKDLINAEQLARMCNKLLDQIDLPSKKTLFGKAYYTAMIKISVAKGELEETDYYGLKFLKLKDTTKEGIIIFGGTFLMMCQLLATYYSDKCQNLEKALFWITRLHDTALELTEANLEKEIVKKGLEFYKEKYLDLKRKVFDQKIEYTNALFKETKVAVEGVFDEVGEEFVKLKVNQGMIFLSRSLRAQSVICTTNNKESLICVYNITFVSNKSLQRAISQWKSSREIIVRQQQDNLLRSQQPPIALTPVVSIEPIDKPSETIIDVPKKVKVKTKAAFEEQPLIEDLPVPKVLKWADNFPTYTKRDDSCMVFKVDGETVKNHYVCINSELFAAFSSEPLKLKGLVSLLRRGKVLGDSQGGRGLIIKGENAEAKDAGHDHRFFGNVVSSVEVEGKSGKKTKKLIEINGYKKTHNQQKIVQYGPNARR